MVYNFSLKQQWLLDISPSNFEEKALALYRMQYELIDIYQNYCKLINRSPDQVKTLLDIPFLPINFFKSHKVLATGLEENLLFESSGTTGSVPSRHYISDAKIYETSFRTAFKQFYGDPKKYIIVGLLPSYLERKHSSLVYMVKDLIEQSGHAQGGFYLNEWESLATLLQSEQDRPIFLIGVTFGLLDFADAFPMALKNTIVMETGGMKGRREEWTRMAVHDFLKEQWQLSTVHSEYGMSELLSQAYSKADGIFIPAQTMKVLVRDENDPLSTSNSGSGLVNIIDLANIESCAFIATEDVGKVFPGGQFEILGRRDTAALRGCSLMAL